MRSLLSAREGAVPKGPERRKVLRRLRQAGPAAIPSLFRALGSRLQDEADWATFLLTRLGGPRVIARLSSLLQDVRASDGAKARAIALLAQLEAPLPPEARLHDPDALLRRSVRELLSGLDAERDLEEGAVLIVQHVPDPEIPAFAAELLRHGGRRAAELVAVMVEKEYVSAATAQTLTELRREALNSQTERALSNALDRGLEYLDAGKPRAARRRLEKFVAAHPQDAEGRSALGVCLLELGQVEPALEHLGEAVRLDPAEPLHHWNLASACKEAERMGGCYLALRDYLEREDATTGADDRTGEARAFVRAYEKMLQTSHPGVPLADVLRGEELFARAYAALTEEQPEQAATGFEQVIALVPRHYPSWANLGAAYLAQARRIEAMRCFERALELNPDYAVARKNLQLLAAQQG